MIVAFAGTTPPAGWALCDGQELGRATNPALFAALGTSWGAGNGSTTFNLPDLRGRFLRGVDQGAQRDPDAVTRAAAQAGGNSGDAVGSVQADQLRSHSHLIQNVATMNYAEGGSTNGLRGDHIGFPPYPGNIYSISFTGGAESRPINAAVNWIIKVD